MGLLCAKRGQAQTRASTYMSERTRAIARHAYYASCFTYQSSRLEERDRKTATWLLPGACAPDGTSTSSS